MPLQQRSSSLWLQEENLSYHLRTRPGGAWPRWAIHHHFIIRRQAKTPWCDSNRRDHDGSWLYFRYVMLHMILSLIEYYNFFNSKLKHCGGNFRSCLFKNSAFIQLVLQSWQEESRGCWQDIPSQGLYWRLVQHHGIQSQKCCCLSGFRHFP